MPRKEKPLKIHATFDQALRASFRLHGNQQSSAKGRTQEGIGPGTSGVVA
ncbi:MAG: hypothetical protein IPF41_04530 [Flavobacteriales bacterium]|nr:hypothetical protein [Flavobacteriales bacterium]